MVEHIERQTKQKDAIRAALVDCEEFISAQDLHRRLEDEGSKIGLATVYRQLTPWPMPVPPTRSAWTASSCSAYAATTDITTTWCASSAAKPWKSIRPARLGCAK